MTLQVLIVDDDARLFELLQSYLEQNGVSARSAPDGPTALRLLESTPVDALLLDVMMPGMDGLSVLRKIRETSDLPIIMLTAKGDETDRVVGLELGADDYLAKPFSPRELLARLRALVRRADYGSSRACFAEFVAGRGDQGRQGLETLANCQYGQVNRPPRQPEYEPMPAQSPEVYHPTARISLPQPGHSRR